MDLGCIAKWVFAPIKYTVPLNAGETDLSGRAELASRYRMFSGTSPSVCQISIRGLIIVAAKKPGAERPTGEQMKFKILYKLAISALCLAYLATVPMLAYAQETDTDDRWQFKAAIYLWAAGVESTTRRGNEIDVSFSDIVSDFDMAFMGTFVARKSKWSLAADVI